MKLKYYATVPNTKQAVDYWSQIFDVKVIKEPGPSMHSYIKLYNQISILLWPSGSAAAKPGYYVIRFKDSEVETFRKAVFKIQRSNLVDISINCKNARWGTTLFEFRDQLGFTWVLEINTSALGENLKKDF